jgi:hypothetical protein
MKKQTTAILIPNFKKEVSVWLLLINQLYHSVLFSGALHKQFLETAAGFIFVINYIIVPRLQLFKSGSYFHA